MKSASWVACALLFAVSGASHAAMVTIDGADVSFTYDPSSFVIGPGVSNDNASYSSNTISAVAGQNGADGSFSTSSTVSFIIQLTSPGETFNSISLDERGSYALTGPNSSVSLAGSSISVVDLHSSAAGSASIVADSSLTQNDGVTHGWVASASDSLATSQWANTTAIEVTITNLLTATASAGSTAMISAGFAGAGSSADTVSVGVSQTPLPGTFGLFVLALGLGGAALIRRRKVGSSSFALG